MQVITGDIIGSTKLEAKDKTAISAVLGELEKNSKGQYDYFIRGDSFQVLMKNEGLSEALKIKFYLKFKTGYATRIALGIGEVNYLDSKLSNSDGPAFWLSGQGLDEMKALNTLNSIHLENKEFQADWNIYAQTLDYLERQLTNNQAEVLYWLLMNKTQQEIAEEIGITQSSVNRRIKATGWDLLQMIISHYNQLFNS
jgi:hypothetical protein